MAYSVTYLSRHILYLILNIESNINNFQHIERSISESFKQNILE